MIDVFDSGKRLAHRLIQFSRKYDLKVSEDALEGVVIGQRHEIEESLFFVFESSGLVLYSETGTSPGEYLPELVASYLKMLPNSQWSIESVTSNDEWASAEAYLVNNKSERFRLYIRDVNNSDWVPATFSGEMNRFSKLKCGKTFVEFYSDDPYLVLVLSNEAAVELNELIDEFSEPY